MNSTDDQLSKLKTLLESGVLTQEEFDAAKQRILNEEASSNPTNFSQDAPTSNEEDTTPSNKPSNKEDTPDSESSSKEWILWVAGVFLVAIFLYILEKDSFDNNSKWPNIASDISNLVTSEGVGDYRFGQPMGEVLSGNIQYSERSIELFKGIDRPFKIYGSTRPYIFAISENPFIADSSDLPSVKQSDSTESKITNFRIRIYHNLNEDWLDPLINGLISSFDQKGFSVYSREYKKQKSMIILSKGTFNVFIMSNNPRTVEIVSGFNIRNSAIYKDFYKIFLSSETGILN
ncbi:MAG: SHOCT domain-containing protein [Bacteroides sp.]|nr:SHOCT domain-containing protein [Bacteroides sp.]